MWDMSIFQVVPGLRMCAPRDGAPRRRAAARVRRRRGRPDHPAPSKGPRPAAADLPAVDRAGSMDVLVRDGAKDVLILGIGSMAATSVEVAQRLADQGIGASRLSTRAGSSRGILPSSGWRASTAWWCASRTTASSEAAGRRCSSCSTTSRWRPRAAARHPPGVPRPCQARRHPRADRAHRPVARARHRGGRHASTPRPAPRARPAPTTRPDPARPAADPADDRSWRAGPRLAPAASSGARRAAARPHGCAGVLGLRPAAPWARRAAPARRQRRPVADRPARARAWSSAS